MVGVTSNSFIQLSRQNNAYLTPEQQLKWLTSLVVDLEVGTKWSAVVEVWVSMRPHWLKRVSELKTVTDLCRVFLQQKRPDDRRSCWSSRMRCLLPQRNGHLFAIFGANVFTILRSGTQPRNLSISKYWNYRSISSRWGARYLTISIRIRFNCIGKLELWFGLIITGRSGNRHLNFLDSIQFLRYKAFAFRLSPTILQMTRQTEWFLIFRRI